MKIVTPQADLLAMIYLLFIWLLLFCKIKSNPFLFSSGDPFSDSNVIMASLNFAKKGFGKLYCLPVFSMLLNSDDPVFYTHYPPLPDIFVGLQKKYLGISSLFGHRLIAITISAMGAGFFYLMINYLFGPAAALISLLVFTANPLFFNYAFSIHQFNLGFLLLFSGLFCFVLALGEPGQAHHAILLAVFWLAYFLESLNSFEHILFIAIFTISYSLFKAAVSPVLLIVIVSAPLLGLVLHFLQNIAALGGINNAISDLKEVFVFRLKGDKTRRAAYYYQDFSWVGYFNALLRNISLLVSDRIGPYVGLVILGLSLFLLNYYAFPVQGKIILLIFLASGLSWWVLFKQHMCSHPFTARHVLPAMAVLLGLLGAGALNFDAGILGQVVNAGVIAVLAGIVSTNLFFLDCCDDIKAALKGRLSGKSRDLDQKPMKFFSLVKPYISGKSLVSNYKYFQVMSCYTDADVHCLPREEFRAFISTGALPSRLGFLGQAGRLVVYCGQAEWFQNNCGHKYEILLNWGPYYLIRLGTEMA